MNVFFSVHNSHELSFDHKYIDDEINDTLQKILKHDLIKDWIGVIDIVQADIWVWIEDITAFSEHPYIEISHEQEKYHWGTVNCAVNWSSIYIDRHHELFHDQKHKLVEAILSTMVFMLADQARIENRDQVAIWLENEFISAESLSLIAELKAGGQIMDAERAEQAPILVLEFKTQGKLMGNKVDQAGLKSLTESLDEYLKDNEFGYVDGNQIGGGSMEIFCAVTDVECGEKKINEFLKSNNLMIPRRYYQE